MATAEQTFETVYDVELANRRAGYHWFDPDTKRFFRSRIGQELYGGRYFISSEQFVQYEPRYHVEPRRYTIREAMPDGQIETVGEFQQYASRSGAVAAIKRLLATDN